MVEGMPRPTDGLGQDPVVAGVMKDLSLQSARHLEAEAEALVPQLFQGLATRGKAVLMEVACEPDSIFTSCVRTATGREDSAMRCSLFNSCDLGTNAGIRLILEHIDREEPSHVWLSPPCGPYSPIQNCNQRSPQQIEALQNKRKEARKLYQGCCIIFRYCVQRGIHVTWEMSERCLAWRLPALNELKQQYQLWESVTKGCAVNLRESPKGKFLKKGWKLLTTHRRLAQHMNLPCRCPPTYLHAVCEGRVTRQSGLYAREFGNRVAKLLLQELDRPQVQQECAGVTCLPEASGEGSRCVCSKVKQPNLPEADCAFCMLGSKRGISSEGRVEASGSGKEIQAPQVSRRPVASGSDLKTQVQDEMEELLSMRTRDTKPSFSELENVMKQLQELYGKTSTQTPQARWSFGIRKQGEAVSMHQDTFQYPHLCRWLNELAKQHMPKKADWNTIEVYLNCPPPIHKKGRGYQDGKIGVFGVGPYTEGDLWVSGACVEQSHLALPQAREDGIEVAGYRQSLRQAIVQIDRDSWFGVPVWKGFMLFVEVAGVEAHGNELPQGEDLLHEHVFPVGREKPQAWAHAVREGQGSWMTRRQKEDEQIRRQLYLLHAATGHGSVRHLIQALRRRNASARVLELAKTFECSSCKERQRVQPRRMSSLEPLPPKWHTIAADIGHWENPQTHEKHQFMVIIDEGSRFRAARTLTQGSRQSPSAAQCLQYLREGWCQYFGDPKCLRLDPAGAFRSQAVEDFCDRRHIYLDLIPGEAHWQIGVCEQAVQGIKDVMTRMCEDHPEDSAEDLLSQAVRTFNSRDVIRGFSPIQHAFGRAPDATGRVLQEAEGLPEGNDSRECHRRV